MTDWAADELRAHAATVRVARRDDAVAEVLHAAATSIGGPDLRHGQLQSANGSALLRRRVLKTVAMLTIFLLTYVVNLHHRRDTFVEGVNQLHPLRDAAYAAVFPGRDFTPAAALRVRSEVIKLEALTDAGSSTSESLAVTGLEVFHVLHMVTERIPVAVKVFVREIVMDDRGLRLSGQTTSHGAAGELVQQLNLSGDLVSDPPRTRKRIDGTVDFEVRVRRAKS